ncbi:IS200/IS605 family accessory protein TnpB-related protein [Mastigocoleus testarum]|uniref:Transposase n=1 Tax=Mastigocoleus testarum BC008 TaxID=371196 RepID=A0A0V7ZQY4_9CYAN|nr:IS200/IS605 family accessory protein TnpB-related protein [Mastigocoleus testarum]KST66862.1 transposase [Mastigocoleus testarum BC008]KST70200.1 transposase [Mastigocoleus testarum BC008]
MMSKKITNTQSVVRTDVWNLVATSIQKQQMIATIEEYRRFLKPLVLIVNAQWISLDSLTSKERINAVERMIHRTVKNPHPKHLYFQKIIDKYPSFRKFPSYLRRAAISDAIGIVSSFHTRYKEWQSGIRKKRQSSPPKLTAMCNSYPALYKGQQVRYGLNYKTVDIKVWNGFDWIWLTKIPIIKHGLNRHLVEGNKIQSPALVVNKNKCQLSMPVQIKKVVFEESDFVCSVDMGINNAATASIVGRDGTVKARNFVNPARDIDRRNQRRMMIAKKSKQTRDITKSDFIKGFCRGLYRKSANINLEISRKVVRGIVSFAKSHNIKLIVFENLAGWKAKAGRKKSLQKQKFHLWCHRKIVELTQDRWMELGGKVVFVNPKYTSAYAFDGSGKVKRSKINYSLCRFSNGKNYNADLNASYNIGARYWYSYILGDKNFSRVFVGKSSNDTLRTPVTLETLRSLKAA